MKRRLTFGNIAISTRLQTGETLSATYIADKEARRARARGRSGPGSSAGRSRRRRASHTRSTLGLAREQLPHLGNDSGSPLEKSLRKRVASLRDTGPRIQRRAAPIHPNWSSPGGGPAAPPSQHGGSSRNGAGNGDDVCTTARAEFLPLTYPVHPRRSSALPSEFCSTVTCLCQVPAMLCDVPDSRAELLDRNFLVNRALSYR